MEKIVNIEKEVHASLDGFKISVKGQKGTLERDFYSPLYKKDVKMEMKDGKVKISTESENRKLKSVVGAIASHVSNMINGVINGYTYKLKIVYMHFPFTVKVDKNQVIITNFLGGKAPRKAEIVGHSKVDIKGEFVTVTGINKEHTGQTSANIEKATHISKRDRRIFQDGIFLVSSE